MHQARDVEEDREQDVDPEVHADTDGRKDAERRQQDGEDDAEDVDNGSFVGKDFSARRTPAVRDARRGWVCPIARPRGTDR